MKNIFIEENKAPVVSDYNVEFVERKGLGHPDTLIDGIVEKASVELSKYYLSEFGRVLHYNIDKGLIVGGSSNVGFGWGEVTKPIEVIIAGRATDSFEGKKIPVDDIVIKAAEDYLKENTRFLDLNNEVVLNSKILRGSSDLNQIFTRSDGAPLANDTSFGIGFHPLTETEKLVLETERFLNSKNYKKKTPAAGEDIKVMGVREKNQITLTIAIAFVAKLVNSIEEYIQLKEKITADVLKHSQKITGRQVSIIINNGDSHEKKEVYLTKTGLSCESGDDGEVGRGNRINGLITPFRSMSLEAAAGKNPVNHVGKIYNVLSEEIAKEVATLHQNQVKDCTVLTVSQIGRSIADPKNLNIRITMKKGEKLEAIQKQVQNLAEEKLENITKLTREIIQGKHQMF